MAENRGGFRPIAPQNNPANVSATGGAGQSGTQPARYISGLPYGQGQATMMQQTSAPMAGNPVSAISENVGLPQMNFAPIVPLTAPTQRPEEPISTGMDFGAGPGTEILNLPRQKTLSDIVGAMIEFDPTGDAQDLYNFVVSRGL